MSAELSCPLCSTIAKSLRAKFPLKIDRVFGHCPQCDLVFANPKSFISLEAERAHYLNHAEGAGNEGHLKYLSPILEALRGKIKSTDRGLDFGCGPAPIVQKIFQEAGFSMASYDPQFFPEPRPIQKSYDYVTCTEVVEHFRTPLSGWDSLKILLAPQGKLAVMTQMLENWDGFEQWHYPRDITHLCFYSRKTMQWIAVRFGWRCEFFPGNVTIFFS